MGFVGGAAGACLTSPTTLTSLLIAHLCAFCEQALGFWSCNLFFPFLPVDLRPLSLHPTQVLGFWSYYRSQCGYDADALQEWVSQVGGA